MNSHQKKGPKVTSRELTVTQQEKSDTPGSSDRSHGSSDLNKRVDHLEKLFKV